MKADLERIAIIMFLYEEIMLMKDYTEEGFIDKTSWDLLVNQKATSSQISAVYKTMFCSKDRIVLLKTQVLTHSISIEFSSDTLGNILLLADEINILMSSKTVTKDMRRRAFSILDSIYKLICLSGNITFGEFYE